MGFVNACFSMLADLCSFHAVYFALIACVALIVFKLACFIVSPRH